MRLRAVDLAATRGDRRIFAGASFVVEGGQTATLRGPNGSGKTTMLRTLAGLSRAAFGEAWAGDVSTATDLDLYQERVAYAGHADALKPAMTPRETLTFWGEYFGAPAFDLPERVRTAMARFGVDRFADDPAGRLSAGQRRRVGLARLLLIERPIWLLDEPTAALDAEAMRILTDVLEEHVAQDGVAVLAVHGASPVREDVALNMSALQSAAMTLDDPFLAGFDDGGPREISTRKDS